MPRLSLKMIIIAISLIVVVFLVLWINDSFKKEEGFSFSKIPVVQRDEALKKFSFIAKSKNEIAQYALAQYEEIKGDESLGVADIYYFVGILKNVSKSVLISSVDELFEKIKSFYSDEGYYLEEGSDPIFTTMQSLKIDRWFEEDLENSIDVTWLENNSLMNEQLEESKYSAEYQAAVVEAYENADFPDKAEKQENLSYLYFDRYCSLVLAEDISDSEYLKEKFYQLYIISRLTGLEDLKIKDLDWACLKNDFSQAEEKIKGLDYKDFDNIKEIYRLYFLKKAYGLDTNVLDLLETLEKFYQLGGFKNNLSDESPCLEGTYYGTLFLK